MTFNDKQLQILTTAEQMFAIKGFDGTSVRDISEAAGVNVAMISYYFGSKEKLIEALFEFRIGYLAERMETLLKDETLTPLQKIGQLIDEHIDRAFASDRRSFFIIMTTEQLINKTPSILKKISELKKRTIDLLSELVQEGQVRGQFKKKIDFFLMLNTMVGTVSQTMCSQQLYRDLHNQQDMSEEDFTRLLKRKLSIHIQTLVKAILNYEA
jgi:AcrR family transcriptional regulator